MEAQVLVLDQAMQPVSRIDWQVAMTLFFKEKVEVLKYYKDKFVHSAHKAWAVPAVVKIVTGYLVTNKKRIKFSRENVYARDNNKCQYCNNSFEKRDLTWDHVLPRAQAGTTKWENVTTSCYPCNQKKGNRTPEQSGMYPKTAPVKPTSLPQVLSWIQKKVPDEWLEVAGWLFDDNKNNP